MSSSLLAKDTAKHCSYPRKSFVPEFLLFLSGSALNLIGYVSIEPIFVALVFLILGVALLNIPAMGGYFERVMFARVFLVSWVMIGIGAIYANYLDDWSQIRSDSANNFWLVRSEKFSGLRLDELKKISEGSLALLVWRSFYDTFASFGFEKGRHIGVLINSFLVAFTGVVAVKMARILYGNDVSRFNRLILFFSFCGMFWLFAAVLIRDAFALLAVSILAYAWTRYLSRPEVRSLVLLVFLNLLITPFIGYIREEFLFVPVIMLWVGLIVRAMFQNTRGPRKFGVPVVSVVGIILIFILLPELLGQIFPELAVENSKYIDSSTASHSDDSLGLRLIVNQKLPARLIFGSIYLFIFPIPFWSGFQLETVYHVFKSCNVIFFYLLIPLFILSIQRLIQFQALRTPGMMFNVALVFGFTLAIAGTSLENRHLGAFFGPLFMVALLPDIKIKAEWLAYKQLLSYFLVVMVMIHFAWAVLKLF